MGKSEGEVVKPLPCPFCNTPEPEIAPVGSGYSSGYVIRCVNCRAAGPSTHIEKAEAIAAWNTRAEGLVPAASLVELIKALEQIEQLEPEKDTKQGYTDEWSQAELFGKCQEIAKQALANARKLLKEPTK